jgi:hypothetical protein
MEFGSGKKLLIVDDEPELLETMVDNFSDFFETIHIQQLAELKNVNLNEIGAVILDWSYDRQSLNSSIQLIRRQKGDEFPVLIHTGDIKLDLLEAYLFGASAVFRKPSRIGILRDFISRSFLVNPETKKNRDPRVRVRIPCQILIGQRVVDGVILNKSHRGCFVFFQGELPACGQKVRVISKEAQPGFSENTGIARWVSDGQGAFPRGVGLELTA